MDNIKDLKEEQKRLFYEAKRGDKVSLLALYRSVSRLWLKPLFCDTTSSMEDVDWQVEGDLKFFSEWHNYDPNGGACFATWIYTLVRRAWMDIKKNQESEIRKHDIVDVEDIDETVFTSFGLHTEDTLPDYITQFRKYIEKDAKLAELLDMFIFDNTQTKIHYAKKLGICTPYTVKLISKLRDKALEFSTIERLLIYPQKDSYV